jgi:hypothetical protein
MSHFDYMLYLAIATIGATPSHEFLSIYPQTWYIEHMYLWLHFIHQNIICALCGSCTIGQTPSKKPCDISFDQLVYIPAIARTARADINMNFMRKRERKRTNTGGYSLSTSAAKKGGQ